MDKTLLSFVRENHSLNVFVLSIHPFNAFSLETPPASSITKFSHEVYRCRGEDVLLLLYFTTHCCIHEFRFNPLITLSLPFYSLSSRKRVIFTLVALQIMGSCLTRKIHSFKKSRVMCWCSYTGSR